MRIEAYLRIVGDEDTVRTIERETHLPNASIKPLKARRGGIGKDRWWPWRTPLVPIDINNVDAGLKELLLSHRQIFPTVKKYEGLRSNVCDVYLEVVTQYEHGEEPRDPYLSAETVLLLSEMGGSLDVDAVLIGHKSNDD